MLSLFRGVGLGYSPVLHKCANPDCSQPFKYFRHGKLFSFEMESRSGIPEKSKKMRKVLWLCGRCVRRMTLKFAKESGLVAVPLEPHRQGVAIKPAPLQRIVTMCPPSNHGTQPMRNSFLTAKPQSLRIVT